MRIAVLCDVHGSPRALDAALADVLAAGVDLAVFGGDVAAGPQPVPTIERLMSLPIPARFVRGNTDREMVEAFDAGGVASDPFSAWPAAQLDRSHRDFLAAFEPTIEVAVDGLGAVLCCHAGPSDDSVPIITPGTADDVIGAALAETEAPVVVGGHTHMQFERTVGGRRWVNAGSVGMPYADRPGAYWALLGPDIVLRRTDYDFEAAAAEARRSGWPRGERFAANIVRPQPPREAIALFEGMSGPPRPA
jgi:predicted phosphodiesterase